MNALTLCNACDSAEATNPAGYCAGCDPTHQPMTHTDWIKTGYADGTAQTPWANAPRTFDEWMSNPIDTPADVAYWNGFNASTEDAYRKAGA